MGVTTGVVLAAVYMIRFYQRSMHNRVGGNVQSYDLALPDQVRVVTLDLVLAGAGPAVLTAALDAVTVARQDLSP